MKRAPVGGLSCPVCDRPGWVQNWRDVDSPAVTIGHPNGVCYLGETDSRTLIDSWPEQPATNLQPLHWGSSTEVDRSDVVAWISRHVVADVQYNTPVVDVAYLADALIARYRMTRKDPGADRG